MGLTYKDAGVDKTKGYEEVKLIKSLIKSTNRDGVLNDIGNFSGLFKIDLKKYDKPVLVSGTDGVGTKLKLAFILDKHDTIGIDAVAMCVNDIICQGAEPLFFLDYIASSKLIPEKMAEIVSGVAEGCKMSHAALIGGETAEMPGFYGEGEYDIAGFAVGVVNEDKIIDGSKIEDGDVIIGLRSSGVHSNGFSLVRKIIFNNDKVDVNKKYDGLDDTLLNVLLTPTRIYYDPMMDIIEHVNVKAISHITGGGFYENIPRMIKDGYTAVIDLKDYEIPQIFKYLMTWADVHIEEMFGTFNMGIGMVFAVSKDELAKTEELLKKHGEDYIILGHIEEKETKEKICLNLK